MSAFIPEKDQVRLRHMLDAARMAHGFVQHRKRGDLSLEHLDTLGLVKCLENIGEAANQLDDSIGASPAAVGRQLFLRGHRWLY